MINRISLRAVSLLERYLAPEPFVPLPLCPWLHASPFWLTVKREVNDLCVPFCSEVLFLSVLVILYTLCNYGYCFSLRPALPSPHQKTPPRSGLWWFSPFPWFFVKHVMSYLLTILTLMTRNWALFLFYFYILSSYDRMLFLYCYPLFKTLSCSFLLMCP